MCAVPPTKKVSFKLVSSFETASKRGQRPVPSSPTFGPQVQRLARTLELKADRADLAELFALKANRMDGEELSRNQEARARPMSRA